jgi:hypothetical protein
VNRARNKGLELSKFDIVYFLDDDCELHLTDTLAMFLKLHKKHPDIFAFGGGYRLNEARGVFDDIYNYIQMSWFVSGQDTGVDSILRTGHLLGGNFSLKRPLAVKYNLQFDPGIIYGGSELDFFKQAVAAGLKLAAVDIDVTHNTDESLLSVAKKVYKQGRGKCHIDQKFGVEKKTPPAFAGGKYVFIRQLYSYCFWLGYYGVNGQRRKLSWHVLKDVIGYLNALRFNILKKISGN